MPPGAKKSANTFTHQLTQALKRFHDPAWLGANSPLAAPYFLGDYLQQEKETKATEAEKRGYALQRLLRAAAEAKTQPDGNEVGYQNLLKQIFFQHPNRRKSDLDIQQSLAVSRAVYYRRRAQAIEWLEKGLLRQLNPALRLENPILPQNLIGRDRLVQSCLDRLEQGQTVALTGSGGVGKSALGGYLTLRLKTRPIFWFTLRPGLNDRLESLFFALAYFLHRQGVSGLWLQLTADEGRVNLDITPGLARHDLEKLGGGDREQGRGGQFVTLFTIHYSLFNKASTRAERIKAR